MVSLQQLQELLGDVLPKDVQEDPYNAKEFEVWIDDIIKN